MLFTFKPFLGPSSSDQYLVWAQKMLVDDWTEGYSANPTPHQLCLEFVTQPSHETMPSIHHPPAIGKLLCTCSRDENTGLESLTCPTIPVKTGLIDCKSWMDARNLLVRYPSAAGKGSPWKPACGWADLWPGAPSITPGATSLILSVLTGSGWKGKHGPGPQ